jgi:cation diffusion facilitator CzcD-associated flavoprotein CzcO
VQTIFEEITSIDGNGLHTGDGQHHEVDIIVCATGFAMAWTPHFELIGLNGENIKDSWAPEPNCYLGMGAPGFPNYFVMNGPRGSLCNGTVLPCLETEIEYVIKAAKKMQQDRIKSMFPSQEITKKLNEYVDKWASTSVWAEDCKSWYKNNSVNGKIMCWGGSVRDPLMLHYL